MSKYTISSYYSAIYNKNLDGWHRDLGSFEFNYFVDWITNKTCDIYIVNDMTANTPDLISYIKYGSEELYWIICLANKISNPFEELPIGKKLFIPKLADIDEFINYLEKRGENAIQGDRNKTVTL